MEFTLQRISLNRCHVGHDYADQMLFLINFFQDINTMRCSQQNVLMTFIIKKDNSIINSERK